MYVCVVVQFQSRPVMVAYWAKLDQEDTNNWIKLGNILMIKKTQKTAAVCIIFLFLQLWISEQHMWRNWG